MTGDQAPARDPAQAYIEACGHKDFGGAYARLHPAFEARSGGRTANRDEWIAGLRRLSPILVRYDVRAAIIDRGVVCVLYDFVSDTAAGAVPCAEFIGLEDGLVRSTQLAFDYKRWPEVLGELQRRPQAPA